MIRIGLVGCGHIGTVHSFALRQLVDARLVDARVTATFDIDLQRAEVLAHHHDARACTDLRSLVEHVDAVWICTWTAAHLEAVEAAVDSGRAVFCEKPLAPSLAGAERIATLLERVPHQVGLVLRHAPVFHAIAGAIASGRHGRPLAAVLRDDQYFPIQGMYASEWRAEVAKAGGGTLLEHSIHDVDVLRRLFGDPVDVSARAAALFGHEGIDDSTTLTFGYPGGLTATIVSVWHQIMTRGSSRRLEVFCEEALMWTDDDYLGPLHVETGQGEELLVVDAPEWVDRLDVPEVLAKPLAQYAEPTKAFLDALSRDGAAARGAPDVTVALAAHRLVDVAYRSAAGSGAPIALEMPWSGRLGVVGTGAQNRDVRATRPVVRSDPCP